MTQVDASEVAPSYTHMDVYGVITQQAADVEVGGNAIEREEQDMRQEAEEKKYMIVYLFAACCKRMQAAAL